MRHPSPDYTPQQEERNGGDERCLNSELWHACAGPLVSLPTVGGRVVYFPQGHSEQVVNSTHREVDAQSPNYTSLPPQLVCQLHDLTMHADLETDEVYAQMTLQPLSPEEQKEVYLPAELGISCKQPTNYFCKTLTASDTSTHGGFSVPRRAAEKVFPPLDFSQQPPVQELVARDLHDNEWKFRHIFRGQPKRHLLTTGWSVFVSAKRLVAGDSVLFIWTEKNQLFIGIRRASRTQTVMPSSVLSSDSMYMGLLASAAHAASTNSRFTIFYNPRASPTEFVIPLSKYVKAVYNTRVSIGMRFRMMVETEESSVRRYMGTITGISDLDSARWPNSHWRSVKVGWDESTAGEKQQRVSLWEIEPLSTYPIYPTPFSLGLKRPWSSGIRDSLAMNRLTWFQGDLENRMFNPLNLQGVGPNPCTQPRLDFSMLGFPNDIYQSMAAAALQDMRSIHPCRQLSSPSLHFQQSHTCLIQSQGQQSFLQHLGQQNEQPQLLHQHQIPNLVSSMPHFASASPPMAHQQQHFSDLTANPDSSTVSSSVQPVQAAFCSTVTKSDSLASSSSAWLHKRARVEPSPAQLDSTNALPLPQFPNVDETTDVKNSLMFGLNIDEDSSLMQSRLGLGDDNLSFSSYNVMDCSAADYKVHSVGVSSICNGGSEPLLRSPDNTGNEQPITSFVKVYKSGSYGRSLDLAKFSSYPELRSELGRMFGLEGQLEDPLRSGWQLVFVDKENDILLVGDDPWMEFVNSVYCIRILSLQELQQVDQQGNGLLGSVPFQKLSNMNAGIPSVGMLEF